MPRDNIIVAVDPVQAGLVTAQGVTATARVMPGHKIARSRHRRGRAGAEVRPDHRLRHPADRRGRARPHPQLRVRRARPGDYQIGTELEARPGRDPGVEPRTFLGYRRDNGQVGTRNYIAVCATVNCSATVIRRAAEPGERARASCADYPNVDGVVAFAHGTGCGMAADGPGFDNLQRVLWGHATHPNVGGRGLRRARLRGDADRPA